jgi:hypothetical protein
MITFHKSVLAGALFASVAAVAVAPIHAQTTAPAPTADAAQNSQHAARRLQPEQLVAGRIAFLKTELQITPAQEALWEPVAAAMRDNAQALDQAIKTARGDRGAMNAVQRVALRENFDKLRAENDARFLAALKPLYASLSLEQQQMADRLMAPHHGWRHRA